MQLSVQTTGSQTISIAVQTETENVTLNTGLIANQNQNAEKHATALTPHLLNANTPSVCLGAK